MKSTRGRDRFSACSLYLHIFSVRIIFPRNAPEIKFRRTTRLRGETGFPLPSSSLSLSLPSSPPLINEINFPRTSGRKSGRDRRNAPSPPLPVPSLPPNEGILTRIARLRACPDTRLAPITPVKSADDAYIFTHAS